MVIKKGFVVMMVLINSACILNIMTSKGLRAVPTTGHFG
jgi:hypothetical protein